jgi:hypothetical protein
MHKPWRHNNRPRRFMRDFHKPRYGNPLFRPGAKRARFGAGKAFNEARPFFAGGTAIVVAVGVIWYVLWSAAFRVQTVEVTGATPATEEAVRAGVAEHMKGHALFVLPRSNILLFDADGAREDVEKQVFLESITLRKKLPGTVVVEVREKAVRAVLDSRDRFYALDESGFVIRELSGKEIGLLHDLPPGVGAISVPGLGAETMEVPVAPQDKKTADAKKDDGPPKENANEIPLILHADDKPEAKDAVTPGTQAVPAASLNLIFQAYARMPDLAGAGIRWFTVQKEAETVDATMAGDWHVFLSSAVPFDVQGERLALVLKEKIGQQKSRLEYVDLRYNERIFYRLKDGAPAQ